MLVAMSLPAATQDCPTCGRLLDDDLGIIGFVPRPPAPPVADRAPVELRLRTAPCGDLPDVSLIMQEIRGLEERALAHAESLAQTLQTCPSWRPALGENPAKLCSARMALRWTGRELDAAADALARAAALFDLARARSQLPEEALSAQLQLAGEAALDLLRRGASAPSANGSDFPEPSAWALVAEDIADIGEVVRALADVELANDEARFLAEVLIAAGAALGDLGASERRGASLNVRVPEPAPDDPPVAQRKMPDLEEDIRWAMDSVALSAERARRAADTATGPVTSANAMPRGPATPAGELAACLNRAALSLSVAGEAQRMMLDLLPEQFPQRYICAGLDVEPASPFGLSEIFDRDLKYEKEMTDLQRCPK